MPAGFDGGTSACIQDDGAPKTSVMATFEGWRAPQRLRGSVRRYAAPLIAIPATTRRSSCAPWQGCAVPTELFVVQGGGHTWPDGWQYFSDDTVGRVSHEDGNADILDFFDANR